MNSERIATLHDESGLVTVGVFRRRAEWAQSHHTDLAAHVDERMVVVGGGGVSWDPTDPRTSNGALLTASYPAPDLDAWLVSSKDHQYSEPHRPLAYAIGLAIAGISRAELRAAIHISEAGAYGQHPAATARLPAGYVLVGGGAMVDWRPGQGSLLTASCPSTGRFWTAAAKDHHYANPSRLRVFAIGLREALPVGRVECGIRRQASTVAHHPRAAAGLREGYALTGGGARTHWRGPGSLLWSLAPVPTPGAGAFAAGAKDHGYPEPCDLSAYAVGIRIVR
jgi:hypothetical protein